MQGGRLVANCRLFCKKEEVVAEQHQQYLMPPLYQGEGRQALSLPYIEVEAEKVIAAEAAIPLDVRAQRALREPSGFRWPVLDPQ